MTEKEDLILINSCLKLSASYEVDEVVKFWAKVRAEFEKQTKRDYKNLKARVKRLMEDRTIERGLETGSAKRKDDWTIAIDAWIAIVEAQKQIKRKVKMTAKELEEQIKETNRRRDNLARRPSKKRPDREGEDSESSTGSERDSLDSSPSRTSRVSSPSLEGFDPLPAATPEQDPSSYPSTQPPSHEPSQRPSRAPSTAASRARSKRKSTTSYPNRKKRPRPENDGTKEFNEAMTSWIKADIERSNREAGSRQGDSEAGSRGDRKAGSRGNGGGLSEGMELSNRVERLEETIAVEAAERREQLNVLNDRMLAILEAVKGAEK